MRTRLAWLLVGISGVCAVADTVVVSAFQPILSEASIAVFETFCTASAVIRTAGGIA